jgi:diaminopimelate decarboxylase
MPVEITLNKNKIKNLLEKYGSPLQIYDGNLIKENLINFLQIMTNKFKNFKQYFAVKALPNPNILKLLVENGAFLDCSSLSELKLAEMIGVNGEKIMFTSNYTSKEDLIYAKDLNAIINLDDISLIEDLKSIGMPNILSFRLNPGIGKTDSETLSNVLGGPNAKFGISEDQIINAYKKAKEYGVNRFGLHIMTGSNVMDINYWTEIIKIVYYYINKIQKEVVIKLEFINIGGGIGIPYKPDVQPINIQDLANIISDSIEKEKTKYNLDTIDLFMENGRFITGPYGWLLSKCNVIKNSYAKYYGLDACMSNLMRPGMYEAYHHICILGKSNLCDNGIETEKANVVGTLCENNDWFAKERILPVSNVNDIFIIYDTGAHSHSMGFQYNGKLRAPEILILNDKYKLIRRKEIFDDYISTVLF